MARDHLGSDYSEYMSDTTTYSCKTISVEKCSYNEDCCTNMCLYSAESSTATCVSKIENLSDYLVKLPEPPTSSIFNLKASCHKNSDCNRLEKCMLFADKSRGICIKLPSPKQTTPKAPEEQTTLFNPQRQSCVIPGLYTSQQGD
ncbi:hypothetical protein G9C98_007457 [Cotesia typhae]|uniref:Uncharacterized protein n=1 Tax=Cotesia typhae TaxID=2053667 RepID=A0A8J5UW38_9HYME|nr:hypothetical protein G9C98_007457 [Cotesia typhae]